MGDELIDFQFPVHVVLNQSTHLRTTLDTTESAAFPNPARDQLEGCRIVSEDPSDNLLFGGGTHVVSEFLAQQLQHQ